MPTYSFSRRAFCHNIAYGLILLAVVMATNTWAQVADQTYPSRPVQVYVPFSAGNTLDNALRQVAEEFHKNTGQPLIVVNKPGGSGIIAAQQAARAAPDGYTLLLAGTSMLTVNLHTFKNKLPYDAEKDFKLITGFVGSTLVLATNKRVPATNLEEFARWVKAQTTPVSYASFTAGNASHFAGVILNEKLGLDLMHVPFSGTPPAVQNLIGEQVHTAFLPLIAVKNQVQSGHVKILGVSSPQRSALMPEVQTFAEQGVPELNIYIWSGLAVPAGTPDNVVQKLNEEFNRVLRSPDIRAKWRDMDFEPMPMSSQAFTQYVQQESQRWGRVVALSGFQIDNE